MKKTCLLLILQLGILAVIAQKTDPVNSPRPEPVNPLKDKQEYEGYTIRLLPAIPVTGGGGSYGFEILKNNRPVVHLDQPRMPVLPKGIQTKADAYKIAQWMIQQYNKTMHWPNVVPPHLAHELKIETYLSIEK